MRPVKTVDLIGGNFETQPDHDALLEAAKAYIAASQRMEEAMQSGFNVHGAMSEIIGATDNLRYAATTNKEI